MYIKHSYVSYVYKCISLMSPLHAMLCAYIQATSWRAGQDMVLCRPGRSPPPQHMPSTPTAHGSRRPLPQPPTNVVRKGFVVVQVKIQVRTDHDDDMLANAQAGLTVTELELGRRVISKAPC
jgi:hypothetical protein